MLRRHEFVISKGRWWANLIIASLVSFGWYISLYKGMYGLNKELCLCQNYLYSLLLKEKKSYNGMIYQAF